MQLQGQITGCGEYIAEMGPILQAEDDSNTCRQRGCQHFDFETGIEIPPLGLICLYEAQAIRRLGMNVSGTR